MTNTSDPVFPTCPTSETTNASDQFDVNDLVFLTIYLRDQVSGTSVNLQVIQPDDTVLFNWDFDLTANYYASWWRWTFTPAIEGEWKWQATYNGETVTHTFNDSTYDVTIGGYVATAAMWNGNISNVRVIKGTALHTSNFTVPTNELVTTSDTVLLACQSSANVSQEATGKIIIPSYDANGSLNYFVDLLIKREV